MVGHDLDFAIGTCGNDGQGVPVADAQPTIRIPEIVMGNTAAVKKIAGKMCRLLIYSWEQRMGLQISNEN